MRPKSLLLLALALGCGLVASIGISQVMDRNGHPDAKIETVPIYVALHNINLGDPIDAKMLSRATIWQFVSRDGGIDVMHEVPGGRSYDELSKRVLHVRLGDIDVPVVGLDDLIQMKLARGHPVDLADVASLTDPDVG